MLNRVTLLLIVRVLVLLIVLAVERAGGLPVWFVFGALSLVQPYDWQTRLVLVLVLGMGLALSYMLPFAVGFVVMWIGVWLVDRLEPTIKSQTLRLTALTVALIVVLAGLTSYHWTIWTAGLHICSLVVVVGLYRLYVTYQVLAPRRLQLSRRLQTQI